MPFNYGALVESQLRGQLPPDVINQIAQRAAERGISTGVYGGPQANAAYLAAIGSNSVEQQLRGQKAYEAQQQIALESRRLDQMAQQFAAELTFKEKQLAQQLGLSEQEYALEKAKMELEREQESSRLGEEQRQFNLNMPLKEQELAQRGRATDLEYQLGLGRLGESARQFDVGQNWNQQQFGEDIRRYNQDFPMTIANLSPQASWNYSWLTGAPPLPRNPLAQTNYQAPKTGSYYEPDPTATTTLYQTPGSNYWSKIRPR